MEMENVVSGKLRDRAILAKFWTAQGAKDYTSEIFDFLLFRFLVVILNSGGNEKQVVYLENCK